MNPMLLIVALMLLNISAAVIIAVRENRTLRRRNGLFRCVSRSNFVAGDAERLGSSELANGSGVRRGTNVHTLPLSGE